MTKKDYELIAGIFRQYFYDLRDGLVNDTSISHFGERMADMLADTNPRFDRQKFLAACGIEVQSALDKHLESVDLAQD